MYVTLIIVSLLAEYGAAPCNATSVLSFDGTRCTPVECGGTLFAMSGMLYSPHWPNSAHEQTYCQWAVVLPDRNRRVRLVIDELTIEYDARGTCFWNYVIVYNTATANGAFIPPLFGRYCGNVPRPMTADGNVVHIWYSVRQPPAGGFSLSFYAT